MATQAVRDGTKQILERARKSLERELARAKQLYGENVEQLAHTGQEAPYVRELKARRTDLFEKIIRDALAIKGQLDPLPDEWKIAIMSNHGDIVISIKDRVVRFQYFGDTEFVKLPWLLRNYPCKHHEDRTLRIDFERPLVPYLEAIKNRRFHRAMDNLNSGHNPWA